MCMAQFYKGETNETHNFDNSNDIACSITGECIIKNLLRV